jgi:hypothetical protein
MEEYKKEAQGLLSRCKEQPTVKNRHIISMLTKTNPGVDKIIPQEM